MAIVYFPSKDHINEVTSSLEMTIPKNWYRLTLPIPVPAVDTTYRNGMYYTDGQGNIHKDQGELNQFVADATARDNIPNAFNGDTVTYTVGAYKYTDIYVDGVWVNIEQGLLDFDYVATVTSNGGTVGIQANCDLFIDWGDGDLITYLDSGSVPSVTLSGVSVSFNNKIKIYGKAVTKIQFTTDTIVSLHIEKNDQQVDAANMCLNLTNLTSLTVGSSAFSNAVSLQNAWKGCTGLTTFPSISTINVTNFNSAWEGCNLLNSFPILQYIQAATLNNTWKDCTQIPVMPIINSGIATQFNSTFENMTALLCLGGINTSSQVSTTNMFTGCTSLNTPSTSVQTTIQTGTLWVNTLGQTASNPCGDPLVNTAPVIVLNGNTTETMLIATPSTYNDIIANNTAVADYRFETSATSVPDLAGNYPTNIVGSLTQPATAIAINSSSAMGLDGNSLVSTNSQLTHTVRTVISHFNKTSDGMVWSLLNDAGGVDLKIRSGQVKLEYTSLTGAYHSTSGFLVANNTDYAVVVTTDGNTTDMYVNGVLFESLPVNALADVVGHNLYIGGWAFSGNRITGRIDNTTLLSNQISLSDVQALSGLGGVTPYNDLGAVATDAQDDNATLVINTTITKLNTPSVCLISPVTGDSLLCTETPAGSIGASYALKDTLYKLANPPFTSYTDLNARTQEILDAGFFDNLSPPAGQYWYFTNDQPNAVINIDRVATGDLSTSGTPSDEIIRLSRVTSLTSTVGGGAHDSVNVFLSVSQGGTVQVQDVEVSEVDTSTPGTYTITYTVTDSGGLTDSVTRTVTVTAPVNNAPVITSTAGTTATEAIVYSYSPSATDPEGDSLTWTISNNPTGMTINTSSGVISWLPLEGVTTSGVVTITVTDAGGLSDTETFTIIVTAVNDAPVINITNPNTAPVITSKLIHEDSFTTLDYAWNATNTTMSVASDKLVLSGAGYATLNKDTYTTDFTAEMLINIPDLNGLAQNDKITLRQSGSGFGTHLIKGSGNSLFLQGVNTTPQVNIADSTLYSIIELRIERYSPLPTLNRMKCSYRLTTTAKVLGDWIYIGNSYNVNYPVAGTPIDISSSATTNVLIESFKLVSGVSHAVLATATDVEDGDLTSSLTTTGTFENTPTTSAGTQILAYSVTDSGGLTTTATESIDVVEPLYKIITPAGILGAGNVASDYRVSLWDSSRTSMTQTDSSGNNPVVPIADVFVDKDTPFYFTQPSSQITVSEPVWKFIRIIVTDFGGDKTFQPTEFELLRSYDNGATFKTLTTINPVVYASGTLAMIPRGDYW